MNKGVMLLVSGVILFVAAGLVSTPNLPLTSSNDFAALFLVAAAVLVIWGVKTLKDAKQERMRERRHETDSHRTE